MEALTPAVAQLGLSIALVIYFVIRDHYRDTNTQAHVEELEKFQRTTLMQLVKETNQHIVTGTNVLERFTATMEKLETKIVDG